MCFRRFRSSIWGRILLESCLQTCMTYTTADVQWETLDDRQRNCPKHIEWHFKNKIGKISASIWFYYKDLSRCTVTCHDARSHVTMHGHVSRCRSRVTMHGHMSRCTVTCHDARSHVTMQVTCHDARSHVTMHDHMSRCTVTCHDARSRVTMHGHMSRCTVTCHDARSRERKVKNI
jgi:hypothetical protein